MKCNAPLFGTKIWWVTSCFLGFYLVIVSGFWVAFMVTVESSFCSCFFFLIPVFCTFSCSLSKASGCVALWKGRDAREAEFGSRISSGVSYRKLVIGGLLLFFQ